MEPYRFTIRGVDPELVRQMRILAIQTDRTQAQLVNLALTLLLKLPREALSDAGH